MPSSFLPSLRQRQAEWHREEEARLAALPDPSVPPGHTLMSREEKKKTLDVLTERTYSDILPRDDSTAGDTGIEIYCYIVIELLILIYVFKQ